jgi:predicted RNA polymerase sigma factor
LRLKLRIVSKTTTTESQTRQAVESAARESYGRLLALLSARTRDVAGAEDALSDALVSALATWPRDGIPKNPQAWLLTAARNRLTDNARHGVVQTQSMPTLELMFGESSELVDPDALPDERLKLLFVCAHPAIDPAMHTPLMLQTVLGLDAVAIGRAFLVAPQTMGQRLVRAKNKIRRAGIAFEIPSAKELPQRLEAVLDAIYAAYSNSWEDAVGADPSTRELKEEAIWLARVLREQMPREPEVRGLLALMLHCEARRPARRSPTGKFVPLSEQDPRQWIAPMTEEAERELIAAATYSRPGRFQLEAASQSVYAERARSGRTNWRAIAALYDQLVMLFPVVGARVARAAAHAEVDGAEAALVLLDAIEPDSVATYQPYWALRAHLLQHLHRASFAAQAFDRAIALTEDDAVRQFLKERSSQAPNTNT